MFTNIDPVILGLGVIIVVLIIAIILGSYHHTKKSTFKPKFIQFSDGSLNMEFYNFGGLQKARTQRFYEQYKVGMIVSHEGKKYKVIELKEIADNSVLRPDIKIVAYLEED